MLKRRDIGTDIRVGRIDENLLADLWLARVALGVWRANSPTERRVAELRRLLEWMSSRAADEPKRRALEACLEDDLRRLANALPEPESEEDAIDMAKWARSGLIERYLVLVADMVTALGQAAHGRVLDLIGCGNLALEEAVRTFSPGPHAMRDEFEAYARERVARALATALQE